MVVVTDGIDGRDGGSSPPGSITSERLQMPKSQITLADIEADRKAFTKACKPLMAYLRRRERSHHPHVKVIVESDCAELVSGEIRLTEMQMRD